MKEKLAKWMCRKNMIFSAIAGETFTNGEVLYTQVCLVALLTFLMVIAYVDSIV